MLAVNLETLLCVFFNIERHIRDPWVMPDLSMVFKKMAKVVGRYGSYACSLQGRIRFLSNLPFYAIVY